MQTKEVTCIILAGGQGKRMGAKNKALIPFKNSTLIEHTIQAIEPQVDKIIISANQNLLQLKKFGFAVIKDQVENQGPLIGITSASTHVNTPIVVVTPCDVINIPDTYVLEMMLKLELTKSDVVVAKTKGRTHYLNCAFKLEKIEDLIKIISKGTLRVSDWQAQMKTSYVEFDIEGEHAFTNLNEPCDFSGTS
jgi:molybdopterin-guanine dinucleotide biosynthesis protein A